MKYFIIVDMQNDFITGTLKNDSAKSIIPSIVEKAKELKDKGWRIVATKDTHYDNYMQTQEGINLPVKHCIKYSDGWSVAKEIQPIVDCYIEKDSFGFNGWKDILNNPEEIAICGTVTEICVASNFSIIKATYPEIPITVYKDLCAGLTQETHESAISVMKCQQAIIK